MTGQSNKSNYDYVAVMYYILIFVYFSNLFFNLSLCSVKLQFFKESLPFRSLRTYYSNFIEFV